MNARKLALLLFVVALAVAAAIYFRAYLTLGYLAQQESHLRALVADHPIASVIVALLLYVAVTGLSLPGATVLTLVYSWLFGFVLGLVLVSFASTAGATTAFLLSRYFFREAVERRFGERLAGIQQALQRDGSLYLFTLRLTPVVPFFVINLLLGLTAMRVRTFWWVSQVGMLPGTAVYVFTGSQVPRLSELAERGIAGILSPQLIAAFVMLGVFPLIIRRVMRRQPIT